MDMMVLEKVSTNQPDKNTTDFGQHQGTRPPDKCYMGIIPLSPNIHQPHIGSSQRPIDADMSSGMQEIVRETQALSQSAGDMGAMIEA
jgi:hypothetical protein